MRSAAILALFLIFTTQAFSTRSYASDLSLRFGSGQSGTRGLFDITPSSDGKILQLAYAHRPWSDRTGFARNLYIEGAVGIESEIDFGQITSSVVEVAPGARVEFGALQVWLSHGIGYFRNFKNKPRQQYSTRLGIAFVDSVSKVSIGLERSHYSTGDVSPIAFSGLDYVGFKLTIPLAMN